MCDVWVLFWYVVGRIFQIWGLTSDENSINRMGSWKGKPPTAFVVAYETANDGGLKGFSHHTTFCNFPQGSNYSLRCITLLVDSSFGSEYLLINNFPEDFGMFQSLQLHFVFIQLCTFPRMGSQGDNILYPPSEKPWRIISQIKINDYEIVSPETFHSSYPNSM